MAKPPHRPKRKGQDGDSSRHRAERATARLAPAGLASAHLIEGRYDESRVWAERAIRDQPLFGPVLRVAAASFALTGRLDEAHRVMKLLGEADPNLRISNVQDRSVLRPDGLARMVEGLRRAGLPE